MQLAQSISLIHAYTHTVFLSVFVRNAVKVSVSAPPPLLSLSVFDNFDLHNISKFFTILRSFA